MGTGNKKKSRDLESHTEACVRRSRPGGRRWWRRWRRRRFSGRRSRRRERRQRRPECRRSGLIIYTHIYIMYVCMYTRDKKLCVCILIINAKGEKERRRKHCIYKAHNTYTHVCVCV